MAANHSREVARLIDRVCSDFGCTATRAKGHWKVTRPGMKTSVTVSHSPSDGRALRNIRADFRRYLNVTI